jgi:nucleoside-diphosphate-sugar epimerase
MSRVLVTGASGFIGRTAVSALRSQGHEVHGVARNPVDDNEVYAWHAANLLDQTATTRLIRETQATHLLHTAWETTHGSFWSDPANLAWTKATLWLFEAFAEAGGSRAVMSGSCAQYEWDGQAIGPSGRANESLTPRRPASLYGSAKQATSESLEKWATTKVGFSYATGLLFFPYGPFDKPERLVPAVTRNLLAGEAFTVTAGNQIRDFIHVEDCGAALAALTDSEVTGAVNIGTGEASSVAKVARTIARILGREDLLRIHEQPQGNSIIVADTARLRSEVAFAPRYDLETGLQNTVDWYRRL